MLFITTNSPLVYLNERMRERPDPPTLSLGAFQVKLLKKICGQRSKDPHNNMHALHFLGKLLLHYKPHRNTAKLRVSCLAEVTVSYIFHGLLCKTFPLGCITFGKIKNVCLSAGQASTYADSLLSLFCLDELRLSSI